MPHLDNWSVVSVDFDPYQPPEVQKKYLHGKVFDHPHFADGTSITTSHIVTVNAEHRIVTGSGSIYSLGEVDPKYEESYPRAKQRLFNNSREI